MTNRILLKRNGVANTAPQAADLEYGELAINYNTGALYFKNASNTIQVIASVSSGTVVGGADKDIQFNDGGAFAGSSAFTFDKTSNLVSISGNANVMATINSNQDVTTVMATRKTLAGNLNIETNVHAMTLRALTIPDGLSVSVPDSSTWYVTTVI